MKTYLFDTINRYKRFSQKLDAQTIFAKAWRVFSDTGEKSLYIFQDDGSLIICVNGIVDMGTWKYIAANQSVMIKKDEQILLFRPAFYDENILIMMLEDTNNCVFLIDESNPDFMPKTWNELTSYFNEKEKKFIQEERSKHANEATQYVNTTIIEKVEELTLEQIETQKRAKKIRDDINSLQIAKSFISIFIFLVVLSVLSSAGLNGSVVALTLIVGFLGLLINFMFQMALVNSKIERWKEEHPDDPACEYL